MLDSTFYQGTAIGMSLLPAGIECGDSESCSALSIHEELSSFGHRFTEDDDNPGCGQVSWSERNHDSQHRQEIPPAEFWEATSA